MPFNRLEELHKVRAEKSIVYAQLYKAVRRLIRAKASYELIQAVEIELQTLPPLHDRLHALQDREYRLMTKAELKQRTKTSHLAREHWEQWQSQGLYLFFLPPSSSEMNLIEAQWHQLKTHEIAGRIFDNEYDLANAIIEGMENRSQQGGGGHCSVLRLIPPSYLELKLPHKRREKSCSLNRKMQSRSPSKRRS